MTERLCIQCNRPNPNTKHRRCNGCQSAYYQRGDASPSTQRRRPAFPPDVVPGIDRFRTPRPTYGPAPAV